MAGVHSNAEGHEASGPTPRVSTFCGVGRIPKQGVLCETAYRAGTGISASPSDVPDLFCFLGILSRFVS